MLDAGPLGYIDAGQVAVRGRLRILSRPLEPLFFSGYALPSGELLVLITRAWRRTWGYYDTARRAGPDEEYAPLCG